MYLGLHLHICIMKLVCLIKSSENRRSYFQKGSAGKKSTKLFADSGNGRRKTSCPACSLHFDLISIILSSWEGSCPVGNSTRSKTVHTGWPSRTKTHTAIIYSLTLTLVEVGGFLNQPEALPHYARKKIKINTPARYLFTFISLYKWDV